MTWPRFTGPIREECLGDYIGEDNLELMWLTGRLAPDFKNIADFRTDHGDAIRKVFGEFVVLCCRLKLIIDRDATAVLLSRVEHLKEKIAKGSIAVGSRAARTKLLRRAALTQAPSERGGPAKSTVPLAAPTHRVAVGHQLQDVRVAHNLAPALGNGGWSTRLCKARLGPRKPGGEAQPGMNRRQDLSSLHPAFQRARVIVGGRAAFARPAPWRRNAWGAAKRLKRTSCWPKTTR